MGDLSDRLLILLIAATGIVVLLVGWEWALVEAVEVQLSGRMETGLYAALVLVFAITVVGVWYRLKRIDEDRD